MENIAQIENSNKKTENRRDFLKQCGAVLVITGLPELVKTDNALPYAGLEHLVETDEEKAWFFKMIERFDRFSPEKKRKLIEFYSGCVLTPNKKFDQEICGATSAGLRDVSRFLEKRMLKQENQTIH